MVLRIEAGDSDRPALERVREPTGSPVDDLAERFWEAMLELNPREQQVMRLRFGLDDGQVRTLGLGPIHTVNLAEARARAKAARHRAGEGDLETALAIFRKERPVGCDCLGVRAETL